MVRSPEWQSLSPSATKLLVYLADQFNGRNNGDLAMPWRWLKAAGWHSQATAHQAKRELLEAGWIVCTRQGGRHRCSLFGVTWEPIDDCKGKHDHPAETFPSQAWIRKKS